MNFERQLWAAVLTLAVTDFQSGHARLQSEAARFFDRDDDFGLVCEGAGLNPDVVRQRLKAMAAIAA